MIKHKTYIDTVALQLDFDNEINQRREMSCLSNWITGRRLGCLEIDKSNKSTSVMKHNLLYGNSKLAKIHTGFTRVKDELNNYVDQYYIRIRFAGLKSYNPIHDSASYNCLMTICAYLNTKRTKYKFVELDVAIDISCNINKVLVACIRKVANVNYNNLGHIQYFKDSSTSYIENYSKSAQRINAVQRAYLYDKSSKEKLNLTITRFELKLQNRFFIKNKFDIEPILNALDRYHVMYFKSYSDKHVKIRQYNAYKRVTSREIYKLKFEKHRLYPCLEVIENFIKEIKTSYVDFYGNVVTPG